MTPEQLDKLASAVYGPRWQSALSRDMNIAIRTISRWAAEGIPKSATAQAVAAHLSARALRPPPGSDADDDRDDACYEAIMPRLLGIIAEAQSVGWHPAEVLAAALAFVVEQMRDGAGLPATIETIGSMLAALRDEEN